MLILGEKASSPLARSGKRVELDGCTRRSCQTFIPLFFFLSYAYNCFPVVNTDWKGLNELVYCREEGWCIAPWGCKRKKWWRRNFFDFSFNTMSTDSCCFSPLKFDCLRCCEEKKMCNWALYVLCYVFGVAAAEWRHNCDCCSSIYASFFCPHTPGAVVYGERRWKREPRELLLQ